MGRVTAVYVSFVSGTPKPPQHRALSACGPRTGLTYTRLALPQAVTTIHLAQLLTSRQSGRPTEHEDRTRPMAHFVFLMLPEPGHLLPTLKVAEGLQRKGHQVSYLATPPLVGHIRRAGFFTHVILEDLFGDLCDHDLLRVPASHVVAQRLDAYIRSTGLDITALFASAIRASGCDAAICDIHIARDHGIALRAMTNRPILAISTSLPDEIPKRETPVPEVILCPPQLDIPSSSYYLEYMRGEKDSIYAEPSINWPKAPSTWRERNNEGNKPLIYCSFGTQTTRYGGVADVLSYVVRACEDIPCRLVISCGSDQALKDSVHCSANVTLLDSAPQIDILAHARLFITHGGLGSIKESIMCGVPLLVIPFDTDQPTNAKRVEYHHIGRTCVPADCKQGRIYDCIGSMLEDQSAIRQIRDLRAIFEEYERQAPSCRYILQKFRQLS
jgi:UDP:flavonoid glycosyltransferase YjiC (YdhE family)